MNESRVLGDVLLVELRRQIQLRPQHCNTSQYSIFSQIHHHTNDTLFMTVYCHARCNVIWYIGLIIGKQASK